MAIAKAKAGSDTNSLFLHLHFTLFVFFTIFLAFTLAFELFFFFPSSVFVFWLS
jgi:hypothetical protein